MRDYTGPVSYPGEILTKKHYRQLPKDQRKIVKDWVGKEFDKTQLRMKMTRAFVKAASLGLPLYCGEFGIHNTVDGATRAQWYKDMLSIFREQNVSWAFWNYKSGNFGLYDEFGVSDPALKPILTVD